MGTVIVFPMVSTPRPAPVAGALTEATIIILPVIRIERHDDESRDDRGPKTRSGGRGSRARRARS